MKKDHYLGMRPGDLDDKPYAAYWNPEMAPLQPQVARAVANGPEAPELGFGLDEADRLTESGALPLENGWTKLPSGEVFVAVSTRMPGVTGRMFEWWMGWHTQEHQRYKLWHPRAHVVNGTRERRSDDPALSDREKYMTTHYVTEYVGSELHEITITFVDPARYFTDPSGFERRGISATVCGLVRPGKSRVVIGRLIHQIRGAGDATEMRSRFWLGRPEIPGIRRESLLGRALGSDFLFDRIVSQDLGRDMLVHCGMEMNHLASFLPALFTQYQVRDAHEES